MRSEAHSEENGRLLFLAESHTAIKNLLLNIQYFGSKQLVFFFFLCRPRIFIFIHIVRTVASYVFVGDSIQRIRAYKSNSECTESFSINDMCCSKAANDCQVERTQRYRGTDLKRT